MPKLEDGFLSAVNISCIDRDTRMFFSFPAKPHKLFISQDPPTPPVPPCKLGISRYLQYYFLQIDIQRRILSTAGRPILVCNTTHIDQKHEYVNNDPLINTREVLHHNTAFRHSFLLVPGVLIVSQNRGRLPLVLVEIFPILVAAIGLLIGIPHLLGISQLLRRRLYFIVQLLPVVVLVLRHSCIIFDYCRVNLFVYFMRVLTQVDIVQYSSLGLAGAV
mmetsp:Transcript_12622/g.30806  ORF Transcript_12622/g.30806 Transcript_12622/m.30806 type:complete len:219 (+) Transcript_12622:124-780(+)